MKAKNYITIILLALAAMTAGAQDAEITAFPGAEGFGRYASGGRGGEICHVTSLRDDGSEGTLRWAVEKEGRKIVVFDVSGTIFLNSKLDITANTTIAGQSAPGDGICVADYPVSVVGDNVIIRYMRFRPGNRKLRGSRGGSWDGFSVMGCDNVIIDHCSVSWSIDECLSVLGNRNTTVQWCIVAQSLVNADTRRERTDMAATGVAAERRSIITSWRITPVALQDSDLTCGRRGMSAWICVTT